MLLIAEIVLLAFAVVAFMPDAPLGKALRFWLIEAPVRAVDGLSVKKIIVGTIVLICLIGFAMSAPELVALIGFGDLAVYLDAAVIAMLLGAAERLRFVLKPVLRLGRDIAARCAARASGGRARDRQTRRHKPKRPRPSGDADPRGDWVFA